MTVVKKSIDADVVVVGFGAAGISTAITAHDAGARVIILEKMPAEKAGGNTRVSGQVWFSPTDVERAKVYLRELSEKYTVSEEIIDRWANETSHNDEWMTARLAETAGKRTVRPDDPYGPGTEITIATYGEETAATGIDENAPEHEWPELEGNDCGNEYHYIGSSQGYSRVWYTLKAAVELRDITVMYDTRATNLVKNRAGEVIGIEADTPDGPIAIASKRGVVLASGGFEANHDMVREFLRMRYLTPWGSPGNTGDGIKMAQKAGADLWHMSSFCGINGVAVPGSISGTLGNPPGPSHMIVGNDGRRFINELAGWRHGKFMINGSVDHWPSTPMHFVFDQKALDAGPVGVPYDQYPGGWASAVDGYVWSTDNSVEIAAGVIKKADSLVQLAEDLGIDAAGLESSVAEYNASCEEKNDARFARPAASLVPVEGPTYYGYTWPNLVIYTQGGPRKDHEARVVDPFGDPIPRLYVAGEISSTYSWMSGGGLMIGDALAFGRIAGRNASALLPVESLSAEDADALGR